MAAGTVLNAKVSVTVLSAASFSIPLALPSLTEFELGEVGIPVDLTGKTYTGGLYSWATVTTPVVFNAEFQTQNASKRVVATGKEADLNQFRLGDTLAITGAVTSGVVESLAPLQSIDKNFTRALSLSTAATATLTTSDVLGSRQELTPEVGAAISGKTFTFSGDPLYGEIIATLDKALLADLVEGLYPVKIYQAQGADDLLLFYGSCEVIG